MAPRLRGLLVYWLVAALCASAAVVLADLLPEAGARTVSIRAGNPPH